MSTEREMLDVLEQSLQLFDFRQILREVLERRNPEFLQVEYSMAGRTELGQSLHQDLSQWMQTTSHRMSTTEVIIGSSMTARMDIVRVLKMEHHLKYFQILFSERGTVNINIRHYWFNIKPVIKDLDWRRPVSVQFIVKKFSFWQWLRRAIRRITIGIKLKKKKNRKHYSKMSFIAR